MNVSMYKYVHEVIEDEEENQEVQEEQKEKKITKEFQKLIDLKIEAVTDVTYVEISRDGTKIALLLPEPSNCLKILDYQNTNDGIKFKEILSIPIILQDFK